MNKKDIIFKFKKSYTISYNERYICCLGTSVNLYDSTTGEHIETVKKIRYPNYAHFMTDGKLVVKTTSGVYFVYDLENKNIIKRISPPKGVLGSNTNFAITPDDKFIIDFADISMADKLMFVEIETGEKVLYDLEGVRRCKLFHNDPKTEFYIATYKVSDLGRHFWDFYMLKYPTDDIVLENMKIGEIQHNLRDMDINLGKIVTEKPKDVITIYDIHNQKKESFSYENEGVVYCLKISKDGRYLALAQTNQINVFDVQKKACIKSFDVDYGCFADFYDNNTKLLVGTWNEGYCLKLFPDENEDS